MFNDKILISQILEKSKNFNDEDKKQVLDWLWEIKKQALADVLNPDFEYFTRYIFREYSKMYNTPLDQVYNLPFHFVLQHYFEGKVENEYYSKTLNKEELLKYLAGYINIDVEEEEEKEFEEFAKQFEKKDKKDEKN